MKIKHFTVAKIEIFRKSISGGTNKVWGGWEKCSKNNKRGGRLAPKSNSKAMILNNTSRISVIEWLLIPPVNLLYHPYINCLLFTLRS